MRISGTFQEIYEGAKFLDKTQDHRPINPVVRCEDGKWMIESELEPSDGEFECTLDEFYNWFYDAFQDVDFQPDEQEFVSAFQQ